MTDKQIINGVDVSKCEFYSYIEGDKYPHKCSCYKDMYGYSMVCDLADCCKNCNYKKLKAKEQECERFRKANDEKNELLAKLGCPTTVIAKRKVFCLQEQLDKLKQTLSDIKPILEVYADTKIGIEQPNGTYSMEIKDYKVIGGTYFITYNPNLAKTALNKINEVI